MAAMFGTQALISSCCRGVRDSAYGFGWRVYEGPPINCKISPSHRSHHFYLPVSTIIASFETYLYNLYPFAVELEESQYAPISQLLEIRYGDENVEIDFAAMDAAVEENAKKIAAMSSDETAKVNILIYMACTRTHTERGSTAAAHALVDTRSRSLAVSIAGGGGVFGAASRPTSPQVIYRQARGADCGRREESHSFSVQHHCEPG